MWVVTQDQQVEIRTRVPDMPPPGPRAFLARNPAAAPGAWFHQRGNTGPAGRDVPPVVVGMTTVGAPPQPERDLIRDAFKGKSRMCWRVLTSTNRKSWSRQRRGGSLAAAWWQCYSSAPADRTQESWETARAFWLVHADGVVFGFAAVLSLRFTRPLNKMKIPLRGWHLRIIRPAAMCNRMTRSANWPPRLMVQPAGCRRRIRKQRRMDWLRREFIANVSHELRTPVTVLRGSLTLCGTR